MTSTLIPATTAALFTADDRCDRCGARATTRVLLSSGGELTFCGHHSRRYDEAIRSVAAEVIEDVPVEVARPAGTGEPVAS